MRMGGGEEKKVPGSNPSWIHIFALFLFLFLLRRLISKVLKSFVTLGHQFLIAAGLLEVCKNRAIILLSTKGT